VSSRAALHLVSGPGWPQHAAVSASAGCWRRWGGGGGQAPLRASRRAGLRSAASSARRAQVPDSGAPTTCAALIPRFGLWP